MPRRKVAIVVQVSGLILVIFTLFWRTPPGELLGNFHRWNPSVTETPIDGTNDSSTVLSQSSVQSQIRAILDPETRDVPRLKCPSPRMSRYGYLSAKDDRSVKGVRYFFALNLRNCLPLLPTLLGSIVEAIRLLGPKHCALSIVEGNSPDGTAEVLSALERELGDWTTTHFVLSNDLDPLQQDRFPRLAQLRNMALAPMLQAPDQYDNATVIFLNDVAICTEDILELIHQRVFQEADMTCAMDWIGGGGENENDKPAFYDVYIARGINGDTFFEIPPDLSWRLAQNLFWNDAVSQARLRNYHPTQVFACWNGAVAFTAAPVVKRQVSFRGSNIENGECHQGEPELFCKDMWYRGHGRIAVVPSVNLEYSVEKGQYIKAVKGYTSGWTANTSPGERIEAWLPPPDNVKCMPTFDRQTWRPWNETLE
ncbi:cryptococcal mannosyltransferase 1-domain-containing protein [Cercophora newfieldiana]|uniref:Cryptococcal mannosyltransferase 1-domain-containing protein n=1 Tax=Cercophora newfieldiana TaxID=92897 RepID=A0AA39YCB9_9PEZI|nr:cryptococcal mannosyltransferase 1-domain-containing protein [Cercophora newfieldiana]